ncbi:methyltransferase domain-containing protein [Aestuariirhabdus sp. Z084]|uniref:methyltransferase n=1 Tax=Aestuariirhabdus haliotis TaxID=2918751 RepID=UPI00201B418D|nr:methyltransferase [Aestuariirhabdus haliotis]MCL6414049.1 methyltransferase domain-containing protein [Aestuariirhabdus haliotis]MCL6417982.1 methyltransferase domain-containing protein [Aestuariirhabdus haliotis]
MTHYYQSDDKSALQAISDAQRIAFAPIIFQATVALRDLGILATLDQARKLGATAAEVAKHCDISAYGAKVLLDASLSIGLSWDREGHYVLSKTGHFVLHDRMTNVNLDFSKDFCYQGIAALTDSVRSGKPEGLKVFGDWPTLYPGLSSLPEEAGRSWFNFDHYYSDNAYPQALPLVFDRPVRHLLDIGGNTGKWARACVQANSEVQVTVVDLPQQLALMREQNAEHPEAQRIDGYPIDWLDEHQLPPSGADAIWMSQFLDCFPPEQILSILQRVKAVMSTDCRLFIMETLWDRQPQEAGALSLNCTSLYFTAMANGNSRMYAAADLIGFIEQAGLRVTRQHDNLGRGHSLLVCERDA